MKRLLAALVASAAILPGAAFAKDTRFWNLTAHTITSLQLSPAGAEAWGPDQTANDADGAVDHDERLKITGVASGVYDVRFTDKTGRRCLVKGVAVEQSGVFSIEEKRLTACTR